MRASYLSLHACDVIRHDAHPALPPSVVGEACKLGIHSTPDLE
jgi:hypothetical protein